MHFADIKAEIDEKMWHSPAYQRVFQYLRRHKAHSDLSRFNYNDQHIEGTASAFLQVVLRYILHATIISIIYSLLVN